jgi:RsiW-degrading membrane proteinase PrsW (M82 family)
MLEYDARQALDAVPMVGVGLVEEGCKLLVAAVVLVLLGRRRTAADGLVVGVAVGAGFATFETMGYAFTTVLNPQENLTDAVDLLLERGALSPAGHMAWTGIAAATLFAAAEGRWSPRRVATLVAAFAAAVGLHAAWDTWQTRLGMSLAAAAGLLLLGWTVHRLGHRHFPDLHETLARTS